MRSYAAHFKPVRAPAGIAEDVGGTSSGTVQHVRGNLKSNLAGGDHTLLETAEQGEDAAKKAYNDVLAGGVLTGVVREVLFKQQTHIHASHDQVKAFRDRKK